MARAIETARQNKVLGHSLDAAVTITAPEKLLKILETHREDLRSLLIVSDVCVVAGLESAGVYKSVEIPGLLVDVSRAKGEKCTRCWNYSGTVGETAAHPTICARCQGNL